jgi:hypothetical protein
MSIPTPGSTPSSKTDTWTCSRCSTSNAIANAYCTKCRRANPNAKSADLKAVELAAVHQQWQCSACRTNMYRSEDSCTSCGTANPNNPEPAAVSPAPTSSDPAPAPGGLPAPEKTSTAAEIRRERAKTYGPAGSYARATALVLQGLLEAHYQQPLPGPIPEHVLMYLFAGIKLTRACFPFKYNADNRPDAHNYIDLGDELDTRRSDGQDSNDRG